MTRSSASFLREGPYFKNSSYYDGTMFDLHGARALAPELHGHPLSGLRLADLTYSDGSQLRPLLRPNRGAEPHMTSYTMEAEPHLTSYTLESILMAAERPFELFDLRQVWDLIGEPADQHDVVFLSTTFICDRWTLGRALDWIRERCNNALVVLGGQFSNLKYGWILRNHPEVDIIVRGDGEHAIPLLLGALDRGDKLDDVPNLVIRTGPESYRQTAFRYIDLETHPSPGFGAGHRPVVPYESMRGCPFSCKFCSFPFASPKWRYKSAEKIAADWARYRVVNEARHTGLLGPLLDPAQETLLVKACYDRIVDGPAGGGRVTELVARPLLNLWWPELAGVAQPLAGEWAARRSLMETLPLPVGYGVELAVLIDTAQRHGTGAIAQVDLGERSHRNRPDADLAVMAAELLLVAGRRRIPSVEVLLSAGVAGEPHAGPELRQFVREDGELRPKSRAVPSAERCPVSSLRLGVAR